MLSDQLDQAGQSKRLEALAAKAIAIGQFAIGAKPAPAMVINGSSTVTLDAGHAGAVFAMVRTTAGAALFDGAINMNLVASVAAGAVGVTVTAYAGNALAITGGVATGVGGTIVNTNNTPLVVSGATTTQQLFSTNYDFPISSFVVNTANWAGRFGSSTGGAKFASGTKVALVIAITPAGGGQLALVNTFSGSLAQA